MPLLNRVLSLPQKAAKAAFHLGLHRFPRLLNPPQPAHVQIEPTVRCNLRCVACSRECVIGGYAKKDLSLEEFDRILAMFPQLRSVKLQGLGEPFLHPHIGEILARLHARNIRTWVTTNGTLLRRAEIRAMIHEHVADLAISIDSANSATFNQLRKGTTLEEILEGVRLLMQERRGRKATVGINCVISQQNHRELDKIADLCIRMDLDYLSMIAVENWMVATEEGYADSARFVAETRKLEPLLAKEIRSESIKLAAHAILPGYKNPARRLGRCFWPFKSAFISVEGFVTPCCIRMHKNHALGNILESCSFAQLWHGEEYRALRASHLSCDRSNLICGACPD